MLEFREVTERFRLEKILKSSRSGSVLRASDLATAEPAVVKLLSIASAEDAEAFLAFAGTLAGLSHASLPAVKDFGVTPDGSAFLVLELLEGRSFETAAGGPSRRILPLLDTVAEGLEVLAVNGLAHRNLAPDNLLLVPAERGGVKMLGLGTALFRRPGAAAEPQAARFRAPEEVAAGGAGEIDGARADVYALVRIACQVLGAPVFYEDTPEPQIELPQSFKFELDEYDPLRMVLQAGLRRDPADRPSLTRLRSALRRAVGAPEPPLIRKRPAAPSGAAVAAAAPPAAEPGASLPGLGPDPVSGPAVGLETPGLPAIGPAAPFLPPIVAPAAALGSIPGLTAPLAPLAPIAMGAAAAAVAPAVPAGSLDDTGGELLSGIGDDLLLDSLESPAPTAPGTPGAPATPGTPAMPAMPATSRPRAAGRTAAAAAAPATGRSRLFRLLPGGKAADRRPDSGAAADPTVEAGAEAGAAVPPWKRPLPLALAGIGLLLAAGFTWWLLAGQAAAPPAPAVAAAPAGPPRVPAEERLATAFGLLGQGEDLRALELLRSLTGEDQQALGPAACGRLRLLEETLGLTVGERLEEDLAAGLAGGNVSLVRLAVGAADGLPGLGLTATAQADLARARQVADLYAKAEAAAKRKEHLVVLQQFGAMAGLMGDDPRDTSGLRDRAAQAIEAEADALVKEARYDDGLARIAPLTSSWPDRPGLDAKVKAYRRQKDDEERVAALLSAAANTERRKKPDEGLGLLRGVEPTPHLQAQYDQTVGRLRALLAREDGRPPVVELRPGFLLEYDRGTFVNLSFRVKDDYKVQDVEVLARVRGGKMRKLPVEKERNAAYSVVIAPGFHQNETVEVYVVATDISGNQGLLGSRDKPLQITRRKGFRES
jgi:Protein kinase domain